ncbi:MAG: cupin domain-containing protein [Acidobacteriaceae bacterium]|nr:cupin domain-containing protein [Acidobacteriaceae bacterium]
MSKAPSRFDALCEQEDLAPLYALGMLDASEHASFEAHLDSCARCVAQMRESGGLALAWAESIPEVTPPPQLRTRVLAQAALPRGAAALVRGSEMKWRPTPFPGVFSTPLYFDRAGGEVAALVRMDAGSVFPAHRHSAVEHIYVLEGDVVFDDHVLYAGDYEAASAGQEHSKLTTKTGCLVFLINNAHDEIFPAGQ